MLITIHERTEKAARANHSRCDALKFDECVETMPHGYTGRVLIPEARDKA